MRLLSRSRPIAVRRVLLSALATSFGFAGLVACAPRGAYDSSSTLADYRPGQGTNSGLGSGVGSGLGSGAGSSGAPQPTPFVPGPSPVATPLPPNATPVPQPTAQPTAPPQPTPQATIPPTPVPSETVERKALAILTTKCSSCHGLTPGLGNINFITDRARLVSSGLVIPNNSAGSPLYLAVASGRMPLGAPLDAASIEVLKTWIDQGAKAFDAPEPTPLPTPTSRPGETPQPTPPSTPTPASVVNAETLNQAVAAAIADIQEVAAADRRFIRYVSMTHLTSVPELAASKGLFMKGVTKAIHSVTFRSQVAIPRTIDAAGVVMRIDLRSYDISPNEWDQLIANAHPYQRQFERATGFSQLRTLVGVSRPIVRGDWFITRITEGRAYKELLGIDDDIRDFERRFGVDADENIDRGRVARMGVFDSGVSFSNRVIERHEGRFGAYWKSYDFAQSDGTSNIFRNPFGPVEGQRGNQEFVHAGGEMIFTLPNGLQAFVLTDAAGNYLEEAPREIVQDPTRVDGTVTNGTSCFTCHTVGWIPITDEIRDFAGRNLNIFSSTELQLVNRLYKSSDEGNRIFQQDIAAYVAAMARLGIEAPGPEPVSMATLQYFEDLDLAAVASELETTEAVLSARIRADSELRRLIGVLNNAPNRQGRGNLLRREELERNFGEIYDRAVGQRR